MDLAMTMNESSDYTVICTWGLTVDSDLILIDMFRKKMSGAEHIDLVWQVYNKWHPQMIYIESVQYQVSLIQIAVKQGLPALELKAKQQSTRHLNILAKFEAHKVFMPNKAPYLDEIENELMVFPNGTHDDIVTCFSYAGIQCEQISRLVLPSINQQNKLIQVPTRRQNLQSILKNY